MILLIGNLSGRQLRFVLLRFGPWFGFPSLTPLEFCFIELGPSDFQIHFVGPFSPYGLLGLTLSDDNNNNNNNIQKFHDGSIHLYFLQNIPFATHKVYSNKARGCKITTSWLQQQEDLILENFHSNLLFHHSFSIQAYLPLHQ